MHTSGALQVGQKSDFCACAADKSLNIVLYRLVFDIWGVTLMQKLQRVLGLMNTEISDIYSQ